MIRLCAVWIKIGEIDYSETLVSTAKKVIETRCGKRGSEIVCGEALSMDTETRYDAVFSNSIFSYFPNEEYAETVLEKMLAKSMRNIAVLDVHYDKMHDDFLEYRRSIIPDYDERYRDLPKLFYAKTFFIDFAEKHGLDIKFINSHIEGYWNNPFIFHCYMYRPDR